ncbi:MAG: acyl carrier protein [Gammaproteobacteria bacterium]|nr:acyl carrier protein [Gammaproteobacteria bacterium]
MTKEEIFAKVKELIVEELSVDEAKVTMDATFESDLGADSLDAIELITGVESEFGVTIPDEEAMNLRTVGAIVEFVAKNL